MKIASLLLLSFILWTGALPSRAQEVEGLGKEVDIQNPPAHLVNSSLLEFLKQRKATRFPNGVEELVTELNHADAAPLSVFIPRGRSAQANSTDELEPRVVIAPHSANKLPDRYPLGFENYTSLPGNDYEGRLFFGFADRTKKGESLSWNRKTHQFDYFVITGMGEGRPRFYEVAQREDCTKCHHNEAPIWVVPPWSEIMNHDPARFIARKVLPKFPFDPIVFLKQGVPITRERTPTENNGGFSVDTASSVGNRLIQASRILRQICRGDLNCRRYLLVAALANPNQSSYLRKTVTRTGNTGNDLTDLDFIVGPLNPIRALNGKDGNNQPLLPRFLDGFEKYIEANWPKDGFAFMAQIIPDPVTVIAGTTSPRAADPLTARFPLGPIPKELGVAYIYDVAFETLGFNFQDSQRLSAIPLTQRMQALQGNTERLKNLLQSWPPSREQILAFYSIPDNLKEAERVNPIRTNRPDPSNNLATVFKSRCDGCHNKPDGDVPFIPFTDMAKLRQYNSDNNQALEDRIGRRTMPPRRVTDRPTEAEYQQMLQFFAAGQEIQPVEQARGSVVTNYMGVRYQNVMGQKRAYIAQPAVSIVQEGYSDDCGATVKSGKSSSPSSLLIGRGSDNRNHLALESYPHYFLGNILQTSFYLTPESKCMVLGVSRNGKLLNIAYNKKRLALGTVSLRNENTTNPPTFAHVAGAGDLILAVGKDGNLYRINYPASSVETYRASLVTLDGVASGQWLKVAVRTNEGQFEVIAETVGGQRVLLTPTNQNRERTVLKYISNEGLFQSDLAANLLDRSSLILNPGAQEWNQ